MHVVRLNIQFLDFTIFLLTKHSETSYQFCFHFSFHDFVTILWHPDKMILAMPYYMCYLTKSAHATAFLTVGTVEITIAWVDLQANPDGL